MSKMTNTLIILHYTICYVHLELKVVKFLTQKKLRNWLLMPPGLFAAPIIHSSVFTLYGKIIYKKLFETKFNVIGNITHSAKLILKTRHILTRGQEDNGLAIIFTEFLCDEISKKSLIHCLPGV